MIENSENPVLSVPQLSHLLGVKTTTLNARFRRQEIPVKTVGRVNFVPVDLALELAGIHKYALMGWLTIQQASRLTGVKGCTIKARCEKGQVEGYIDLTKRLRINPAALESLRTPSPPGRRPDRPDHRTPSVQANSASGIDLPRSRALLIRPGPARPGRRFRTPGFPPLQSRGQAARLDPSATRPYVLPPPREPDFEVVKPKDYGRLESSPESQPTPARPKAHSLCLSYNPDQPVSLSDCALGKAIIYGEYKGTIIGVLDEPFNPKIRVSFPEHQHPLMRDVLLIVGRRRT